MNKLVIFDLDGVLIDSREMHYLALNRALEQVDTAYTISKDEHLSLYDGLNTTAKLKLLTANKGLPTSYYDLIWRLKQEFTGIELKKLRPNLALIELFQFIRSRSYSIAVASNSIRDTVKTSLLHTGLMEYVDYFVSNEDVKRPKPFPEMYWKCMTMLKALPSCTIIIEDSHLGRLAAKNSGANLLAVENVNDVLTNHTKNKLIKFMDIIDNTETDNVPWLDNKLNVLIPMAGAGSRFSQAGYTFPKPLIEVNGKPMIQLVVENLNIKANYIFLVQQQHYEQYHLKYLLNLIAPNCKIIQVNGVTEGAACTTLLAREHIDNDQPLLIANSDQFVEWNSNECMYAFAADNIDAGILTFKATHPKWSYVSLGDDGFVNEVAEKKVISDLATVGVYYWRKGSDYVKYADQMIDKNIRTNNEFYVCPVFNEAIGDGLTVRVKNVHDMWGLGTPEDLKYFLDEYKK